MLGVAIETLLKSLALLGPLVVPREWIDPLWILLGQGTTDVAAAELHARATCEMAAILTLAGADAVRLAGTHAEKKRFAREFIKRLEKEITDQPGMPDVGRDVRLNVMFLPRRIPWLRRMKWYANLGFATNAGPHGDAHLFLFSWQGLCGAAVRERRPLITDLRTQAPSFSWKFWNNPFRMFAWQLRRTGNVKVILSVPIYRQKGSEQNPSFQIVGVINFDAVSEAGADWIIANEPQMTAWLGGHGTILAALE